MRTVWGTPGAEAPVKGLFGYPRFRGTPQLMMGLDMEGCKGEIALLF